MLQKDVRNKKDLKVYIKEKILECYNLGIDLSLYSVDLITGLIWTSFDFGERFSYEIIRKELMEWKDVYKWKD